MVLLIEMKPYSLSLVELFVIIKAPTFVDALYTAPPTGLISNHLLKDLHDFHLLYKEIKDYQKSPSLN